jgi:hypothetical protein
MKLLSRNSLISYITLFLLFSCATYPGLEQALAKRSIEAAKQRGAEASVCGARNYYEAVSNYDKGSRFLLESNFGEAKKLFDFSLKFAEISEEQTVLCKK